MNDLSKTNPLASKAPRPTIGSTPLSIVTRNHCWIEHRYSKCYRQFSSKSSPPVAACVWQLCVGRVPHELASNEPISFRFQWSPIEERVSRF
jgi:hypothetical protein